MPTPYQELRFSHSQIRILKRLKRLGEINRLKIENHNNRSYWEMEIWGNQTEKQKLYR